MDTTQLGLRSILFQSLVQRGFEMLSYEEQNRKFLKTQHIFTKGKNVYTF